MGKLTDNQMTILERVNHKNIMDVNHICEIMQKEQHCNQLQVSLDITMLSMAGYIDYSEAANTVSSTELGLNWASEQEKF